MSDAQPPGGFDFGALLSQLGQVQQNLQEAQQAAAAEEVEGTAGGGVVRVRMTGGLEVLSLSIDRSVVDPDDVEMLEDLVLAAVRDGIEQASGLASKAIGGAAQLPGLPGLPGLGDLGGLLGGGSS